MEGHVHPLTDTFDTGRRLLAANPAVAAMADPGVSTSDKLAVVPTMAFWILAFGDAMALIMETAGDTKLDAILKQHATEDAEHWRWFVADLQTLANQGIGASSMSDAMLRQWGPVTAPVRECAWTLHHLLRTHTDSVIRLGIIEACEHGFEAFMDSMRPVVQASGHYQELKFFGAVHDEAERAHAMHELEDPFEGVDWSGRDIDGIRRIVETVYDRLNGMHSTYAVAIAGSAAKAC